MKPAARPVLADASSARTRVEILIVTGSPEVAKRFQAPLERRGHHVRVTASVLESLPLLETQPPDLLIAGCHDLEAEGTILFRTLARRPQHTLILSLTVVAAAEQSAADAARLQDAVAQARTLLAPGDDGAVRVGELCIDLATKRVDFRGQHIALPPIQFRLLAYLVENAGRVVSAQELLKAVWGYEGDEGEARELVKVHVRQIRRRLGLEAAHADYVQSVRGFGYLVSAPGGS